MSKRIYVSLVRVVEFALSLVCFAPLKSGCRLGQGETVREETWGGQVEFSLRPFCQAAREGSEGL